MTAFMRVGTLLTIGFMLLAMLLSVSRADEVRPALTVSVAPVQEQDVGSAVMATGTVVAWREMPIGSEASGLAVVEVAADEGDVVTKGQLLARLNASVLLAQIAQQQAGISEIEATLANAQSDVRRAHTVSAGVISQQSVEQRETLVKTTSAKLAAARAVLEESRAKLAQTSVTAPTAGTIGKRNVTLGQVVQTGTEMFRIVQEGRIEVDALVPESDLTRIKPQQAVQIIGPDGHTSAGKVRLVAPIVDAKSRLGTVHVELPATTELKPGMFVRAEIETERATALAVPQRALIWRDGKAAVFTVGDDGAVALKAITIGRKTSSVVEVLQGVVAGERIVVEGAGLLNDGDRVRAEVASVQKLAGGTP
ncbi:MAG: efflux RND transporter periplasmic adaptor subunit [Hyphomicrobium sp.]|uniref:efflux RND transporter periplasmic adaptor subunit n=1 Tax=Hyphomicrobium sp. TaxID=82 RepID=UPI0022BFE6AD|nr:efflux RND transporter periplasmic adaptor subunit [Hyphomicrobium sp.]MBZ0210610.1 efflux RND transporter periplasmic adaptor subunit [Hyphomicrobium sp.]MCZ7594927.1 efflux RND transporter periplasmic adaptor subunit [Hyphomicrobium sp.]